MWNSSHLHRGFTLVELSMVLVIISLVVAGVVAGRDLVHTAQTRKTASMTQEFNAAALGFKNKYNCLPGDCANYATFGFTNPYNNATERGNDQINTSATSGEAWNLFQHLFEANMIPSSTPPLPVNNRGKGGNVSVGGGWWVYYRPEVIFFVNDGPSLCTYYNDMSQHLLSITSHVRWTTNFIDNNMITPQTAYEIDKKVDDGLPMTGRMRAFLGNGYGTVLYHCNHMFGAAGSSACIDSTKTPYQYNVTSTSFACAMLAGLTF